MSQFAYIMSNSAITVTFATEGIEHTWLPEDPAFSLVKTVLLNTTQPAAVKGQQLRSMMTSATERAQAAIKAANEKLREAEGNINSKLGFGLELIDGVVYFYGEAIDNELTRRLVDAAKQGFDATNIAKFLNRVKRNPSSTVIDRLYTFLSKHNMPINPDGTFLAYKIVNDNYTDIYTSKMNNAVGQTLSVPRALVDDDMDKTCSRGLHACSRAYLPHYGNGSRSRVVIVSICPSDVVAIPRDYNDAKMRCCGYKVVGELPSAEMSDVFSSHTVTNSAALREAGINMADEYDHSSYDSDGDGLDDDVWLNDDSDDDMIDTARQTLAQTYFIVDTVTGDKIPANNGDKRAFNNGELTLYTWDEEDRIYVEVSDDHIV